jgi:Q-cell neuroblast polarisation
MKSVARYCAHSEAGSVLTLMKVDSLTREDLGNLCVFFSFGSRGCSMAEIWDIEDAVNRGKTPTCERLYQHPGPYFRRLFRNEQYDVIQVLDPVLGQPEANMSRTD